MRKLLAVSVIAALAMPAAVSQAQDDPTPRLAPGALGIEADPYLTQMRLVAAERDKRERRARARAKAAKSVAPPHLQAIASCESGGNPKAVDSSGTYYGKYQFSVETWQAVGGSGSPASASEAEQDRRAGILYARSGPGQWPNCAQ